MDQLDLPPLLGFGDPPMAAAEGGGGAEDGRHHGVELQVLPVEGAAENELQLELPPALIEPHAAPAAQPKFPDMRGRAAYARAQRALQQAVAKAADSEKNAKAARRDLALASSVLPQVGRLVGHAAGKKRVLCKTATKPSHFCGLALAGFLPFKTRLNVGINRKRLIAGCARLVMHRQEKRLQDLLTIAVRYRSRSPTDSGKAMSVAVYTHEWDETRAVFRRCPIGEKFTRRAGRSGVHEQTMVQRGSLRMNMWDSDGTHGEFAEEWLAAPRVVHGSSAPDLWPAVQDGLPKPFLVHGQQGARSGLATAAFDFVLFAPIGDKASANLRILRLWGHEWEATLLHAQHGRFLYMPETCQAHAHHRGKLQLHSLRFHTARHHSVANLLRLPAVQAKMAAAVEVAIQHGLVRRLQPPPPSKQRLEVFFEVLYNLKDSCHDRKHGKSTLHKDIMELLRCLNGDPLADRLEHFCGSAAAPCCATLEECRERVTVSVLNLLMGIESIPSESRWTNLLPNFKKSLTRVVLHKLGILSFCSEGLANTTSAENVNIDCEAAAQSDFLKELLGIRVRRAREYFSTKQNLFELGVLTLVLCVIDRLLHALLGGVERKSAPAKAVALLDFESSLIGRVLSDLAELLDGWLAGGELRKPWSVLDLLGASCADADFAMWARSQILRSAGSLARRYEMKFAELPYMLYGICDDGVSEESKRQIAEFVVAAPRCCLDPFSLGFRVAFTTTEAMLSLDSARLLRSCFSCIRLTTDFCERQNAEVLATRLVRAGARDFTNFARESIIKQLRVVHLQAGGQDPLAPTDLRASLSPSAGSVMPLLALAVQADAIALSDSGQPGSTADGSPRIGGSAIVLAPAPPAAEGLDFNQVVPLSDSNLVGRASLATPARVTLGGSQGLDDEEDPTETAPPKKKVGLNPYLVFKNNMMKAAKAAVGGRTLTEEEIAEVKTQAKRRWESMADTSAHQELYHLWRESPRIAPAAGAADPPYAGVWGGGSRGSPISAAELCVHTKEHGWPKDTEVYAPTAFFAVPDHTVDFGIATKYDLWGCGRSASGVCRSSLDDAQAFDMTHQGLGNFLDMRPRPEVESGGLMLMIEGQARAPPGTVGRELAIVVGTSWSPRAFDLALCKFVDLGMHTATELPFPVDCNLSRRVLGQLAGSP